MLVLEEAHLVVPCTLLAMAVTAPVALYQNNTNINSSQQRGAMGERRSHYRRRMGDGRGVLHAGAIVGAVVYARFMVFDILQALMGGMRPSEGLLIGSLLVLSSCLSPPLEMRTIMAK